MSATARVTAATRAVVTFFSVPWGAFVAAFLFYVGITLVVFSVQDLPDVALIAAYLLPVAAYLLVLLGRALHALAAVPVHIGQLAAPRLQ